VGAKQTQQEKTNKTPGEDTGVLKTLEERLEKKTYNSLKKKFSLSDNTSPEAKNQRSRKVDLLRLIFSRNCGCQLFVFDVGLALAYTGKKIRIFCGKSLVPQYKRTCKMTETQEF